MPDLAWPSHFRGSTGTILRMAGSRGAAVDAASDEALAERVRAGGDATAFALLVTRYRSRVIALAARMLTADAAGREEAEDVAQEAFLAAYDKRSTFQRGQPFRPWLYRIVINRCVDRLRARSRRPAQVDIEHIAEPEARHSDPMAIILVGERESRMDQAVASLPLNLRTVFLLRHLDDLSYEEIAAATGLPLGTVKTHLFRARAALRQALTGYLEP